MNPRMMRLHALLRSVGLLSLMLHSFACGPRDTPVLVTLHGLAPIEETTEVELTADFDARLFATLHLKPHQSRAVVYVPEGAHGSLTLTARVLDDGGCASQKGATALAVRPTFTDPIEAELDLLSLAAPLCRLDIDTQGLDAVIINSPLSTQKDVECAADTKCALEFPRDATLTLQTNARTDREYPFWSGGCYSAGDSCVLDLKRSASVRVRAAPRFCQNDGTCWYNPLPSANSLFGMWGMAEDDVWAVGATGTILHFDGSVWTAQETKTRSGINSISGIDRSDIWAAGSDGLILHFDGVSWSPRAAYPGFSLYGIRGSVGTDFWAVGLSYKYPNAPGIILRYDGTGWREDVSWRAVAAGETYNFFDVAVQGPNDVWVVGVSQHGTPAAPALSGLLLHWDGMKWQRYSVEQLDWFNRVWSSAANDVWAVSGLGGYWHFDGRAWTKQYQYTGGTGYPSALWGNDGDDVWSTVSDGTLLHYDGKSWNIEIPGTGRTQGYGGAIYAAWGHNKADVWAVGTIGTMLHRDGAAWTSVRGGKIGSASSVHGTSDHSIWVGTSDDETLRWDGRSLKELPAKSGLTWQLDMWEAAPNDLWLVGYGGLLRHGDGAKWTEAQIDTTASLWAIGGSSAKDGWAVGASGTVIHFDGSNWSTHESPTASDLHALWVNAANDAWAVGAAGTVIHWDGSGWSKLSCSQWLPATDCTQIDLTGVSGSGSNDVWIVGSGGTAVHWNGSRWTQGNLGTSEYINGIFSNAVNDVWTVGGHSIWHFDGAAWNQRSIGSDGNTLHAVWRQSATELWVVGFWGAIHRFTP